MFLRGEPVIICDFDAPSAMMIACIIGWDARKGVWKARYLSSGRHMIYCWGDRPTRVADFGMTVEADSLGRYRAVRDGLCIATYADGKPRAWQEYGSMQYRWHAARPQAFALLGEWLDRELVKLGDIAPCP